MTDYPQRTVRRHLVFLGYKQPFLDWLVKADPSPLTMKTLNELRADNDAFLIPDDIADNTEKAEKWIGDNWRMFFGFVLKRWVTDERRWPPAMTLEVFREWFDVRYQSMVWDIRKVSMPADRCYRERNADSRPPTYH